MCISNFSEVIVGEFDLGDENPGIRRKIQNITLHENYDSSNPLLGNDIALVRVEKEIPISLENNIVPVCLPWEPEGGNFSFIVKSNLMGSSN